MSLSPRRYRPVPDDGTGILLAIITVLAAVAISVGHAPDELEPDDVLIGLAIVLVVAMLRSGRVPNGAARAVCAVALGQGLWLLLAGSLFTLIAVAPIGAALTPALDTLEALVPRSYWHVCGWALLSVLAFPFTPRKERRS